MFIICHCTDAEKKMLLSKVRKGSGFGKPENKTSKRDGSTSTEDLGLFPQYGYYFVCLVFFHGSLTYIFLAC